MRAPRMVVPCVLTVLVAGGMCAVSAKAGEQPPDDGAVASGGEGSPAKLIDLNTATVAELDGLPGVGRKRAEAIIAERDKRPFRRPTELLRIKGIGPKLFARLRPLVAVGEPKRAGAP